MHVGQIPLGGTATGTGLNTHPKFAADVRKRLISEIKLKLIAPPADPFEAQANRDALVELSGALKVVAVSLTKIAQDIALMGSGPRAGIGEIFLPELQKGSSIMPGKVNPVLPEVVLQVAAQVIGNDTAITIGGMQGQFELNVRIPLIARNLLQSIHLLSTTDGGVRREVRRRDRGQQGGHRRPRPRGRSPAATALNGAIGYDEAAAIVKEASAPGSRCATSPSRPASTRSCTTRRSTCARSPPATRPSGRAGAAVPRHLRAVRVVWCPIGTPERPASGQKSTEAAADERRWSSDLGVGEADDGVAGERELLIALAVALEGDGIE